ncbi:MAG TPA: rhodanese-like domain-containing protein [Myxococcota bacterium]|nr:rhodanese-like domain-containing protein [Myxococcota bacterium]
MRTFGLLIFASLSLLTACGEKGPPGASAQPPAVQLSPPEKEAKGAPSGVAPLGHRELVAKGAPLIDVRTPEEFAAGHVPGAINIPVDEVPSRLAELARLTEGKGKDLVVYCRSGRRSAIAASTLSAEGYKVIDVGPMSAF